MDRTIAIGSRLELMVDDLLIERMDGVQLQLQTPQPVPVADSPLRCGKTLDVTYAAVFRHEPTRTVLHTPPLPGLRCLRVNGRDLDIRRSRTILGC